MEYMLIFIGFSWYNKKEINLKIKFCIYYILNFVFLPSPFFFFFQLEDNICLLIELGPCCCGGTFFGCSEKELLFVVVHALLTAVCSLVAEQRL